ncbi:MAG: glycosyltransferase family 4 protein [Desulfobacterales bacterium]|nr:glycosyltransferase family 4 protein [Desulfobacterales bacterium]
MLNAALRKHGWDVRVGLAWGRKYHDPRKVEAMRPDLKTVWLDGRTGTEEGRIRAIEKAIKTIRPDVVILTCLHDAFEAVRRLRYRGEKFRLLATNHGNLPTQAAALLEHRDSIDMVVCVSRLSYEVMAKAPSGFEPERILHVANAVPLSSSGLKRKKRIPHRVGYAGRLSDDKRARDLVPFFAEMRKNCPAAELWIAGAGEAEEEIRALAESYPGKVRFLGQLSPRQMNTDFYPQVDVLVHFSPSEAWGYTLAEAMSHRVVVVASDFRGVYADRLLENGVNSRIFPVGDTARAAQLVCRLLAQPEEYDRLADQAKRHIERFFSLDTFADSWSKALARCMELPPLARPSRPASLNRKGRRGMPESFWEGMRRLLGRRVPHASPGEEWPHYQCHDQELMKRMEESLHRAMNIK